MNSSIPWASPILFCEFHFPNSVWVHEHFLGRLPLNSTGRPWLGVCYKPHFRVRYHEEACGGIQGQTPEEMFSTTPNWGSGIHRIRWDLGPRDWGIHTAITLEKMYSRPSIFVRVYAAWLFNPGKPSRICYRTGLIDLCQPSRVLKQHLSHWHRDTLKVYFTR